MNNNYNNNYNNYNYNYGRPPQPVPMPKTWVFDPKFGYVEPHKLPLKRVRSVINTVSVLALIMLGASLIFGVLIGVFMGLGFVKLDETLWPESGGIPSPIYYAMQMFLVPMSTGLPFIIYALAKKLPAGEIMRNKKVGFGTALMLIIAGGGLCLVCNFPSNLIGMLVEALGLDPGYTESPKVTDVFTGLCYFIGVAVMPPIFEEFAFRGVILGSLKKYGRGFALVVSSLIFGLMHMSATSIPFATLAGLIMGYVYILTDNIWVPVGIHVFNNAVAVILDIANMTLPESSYNVVDIVLFYGLMALGVVTLIILLITKKLKLPPVMPQETVALPGGTRFKALVTSPAFWCFFVLINVFVVIGLFGGI